jgi:hypothetical protein
MSETDPDDETARDRSVSNRRPLRRVLSTASTALLTAVVERFWEERGCRTRRADRSGKRFVLVRDPADDPAHLVWVDPDATATPAHVERLGHMAASFGDADATLVSGREFEDAVYTAADEHGVECLAAEQLVTLVDRAGLEDVVRSHARSASPDAVADGGATTDASPELQPPSDHPVTVRAGLIVGGGVLSLMALWGGAARLTTRLQSCGTECPLVWAASFLPLLVVLLGSFALAVGVFD